MSRTDPAVLSGLREFDSPTVFNALVEKFGLPNEEFTDHTIRCLLPAFGVVVGYAATIEVTTNDANPPGIPWTDYYEWLEGLEGPLVTVMKDVDSRPGRGASFGDGMAAVHKRLGVEGVIVDGTIRDLSGIERVGLPIWAWGTVPGHGAFNLIGFGESITAGRLRFNTGHLVIADADGCVRVPVEHAEDILRLAGEVRQMEAGIHEFYSSDDFTVAEMKRRRG